MSARRAAPMSLPIVWQRLVGAGGRTCPRCDATRRQVESAVATLREALAPLGVEPSLTVREIDDATFRREPSESNRFWSGGRPMEDWLGASSGSSRCCSVCGDTPCRTTELDGAVFEEIPSELVIRAALLAAAGLVRPA